MGGDHKCSVCQATFTRPQHVARHMRSHTGDRPYKCQYCGDQFARSDLLARHVNKCHANEKQIPSVNANRRKGSTSASRATTSKQACDQCVQSSLPCDGCNPCAKCVQRKSRCTYVKFHRQTAPTGPGHNPRPNSAHSRTTTQPRADDFILGPPPMSVPTMSANDPYTHTFNFPHLYSSSEPHLSASTDGPDFTTKYRTQADLLKRGSAALASTNGSASGVVPGLYTDPQAAAPWLGWGQDGFSDLALSAGRNSLNMHEAALTNRYFLGETRGQLTGPGGLNDIYTGDMSGYGRPRRESVDFGSDGSSTSQSVTSSAASSNIHLPLDPSSRQQQASYQDTSHSGNSSNQGSQVPYPIHHDLRHSSSHPNLQNQEGGFSSAFGLMSIDDPNVIAGLAADGAPFFSNAAMNMAPQDPNITPMPNKQPRDRNSVPTSLSTSSVAREAETRELRDFWKQYMQTPPTGPGGNAIDDGLLVAPLPNPQLPTSPNGSRRARVASFPSAQTPTPSVARYGNVGLSNAPAINGTSSMRTTLHGNTEDLRSYEAAVLARKTPTLNLPRKGRGSISGSSPPNPPSRPVAHPPASSITKNNFSLSRPSSSSSTSSLANALDQTTSYPASRGGFSLGSEASSFARPPSAESVPEDTLSDRPSFKRLPSQTLGPPNAKRALLSIDADNDAVVSSADSDANAVNISKSLNRLSSSMASHRRANGSSSHIAPYVGGLHGVGGG